MNYSSRILSTRYTKNIIYNVGHTILRCQNIFFFFLYCLDGVGIVLKYIIHVSCMRMYSFLKHYTPKPQLKKHNKNNYNTIRTL